MKTVIILLLLVLGDVAACHGYIYRGSARECTHCFAGAVIAVKPHPGDSRYNEATVVVREVWEGDVADTVAVMTEGNRCGAWLETGDECLFMAVVPERPEPGRRGERRCRGDTRDRARLLHVTEGDYDLYASVRPQVREQLGVPMRVANGLTSREPELDEVTAILAGERVGDVEYAAKLLEASASRLRSLAGSPVASDRQRFDRALAAAVRALMEAQDQPGDTYSYLLRMLVWLGPAACAAVPTLLSFQHEVGADQLGVPYFSVIVGMDSYDPRIIDRKAEVLATTKSAEMRRFILMSAWHGPYDRPHEKPQPAAYVRDPDPKVRESAISSLALHTAGHDSLVALANLALRDPDADVAEQCLPLLIELLDDDCALGVVLAGLAHPVERVAAAVFWTATRPNRRRGTLCAVLQAALASQHPLVRMWALEYRMWDGAGCG